MRKRSCAISYYALFQLECAGIKLIIPISFVGVAKRTQVERDGHNMGGTPHAVHALDKCRMSKD